MGRPEDQRIVCGHKTELQHLVVEKALPESFGQSHLPPLCSLPLRPSRGPTCIKENSAVRCSTPGSK
ncbi:hypothetical protein CapIbe_017147 [Capra ibex]